MTDLTKLKEPRNLDAYYYSFQPSGSDEIDAVLEAVAWAGHGWHNTEDWNEDYGDGDTAIQRIQRAAGESAAKVNALIAEVERLNDELSACTEHPGGCGYWREAAKRRAEERDRLKAENEALRQFAAEAYQVLGALDAPENVLDNASDAASGASLRHKTLLPFFAEDYEALRKDAERYRWLKDQGHFRAMSIDMGGNHTWTGMGRNVGCGPTVDDAIDAALEGGGR